MTYLDRSGVRIHYRDEGDPNGAPVLFANSLGTTLELWDGVLPHLPKGLRLIRYDKRGHGQSDVPDGPYKMGTLVGDAEALLDHLGLRDAMVVGLSIGGMIAQGLAVKRLDLVRALVLSNTAAKIMTPTQWEARIAAVEDQGLPAMAPAIIDRWFSRRFRNRPEVARWETMLTQTPVQGYIGCCAAISGTDFYTPTSGLRLPTLGIAGSEDGSTPPDLVQETVALIPGSRTVLMRGTGHLPCVEDPEGYAAHLSAFLHETGHI